MRFWQWCNNKKCVTSFRGQFHLKHNASIGSWTSTIFKHYFVRHGQQCVNCCWWIITSYIILMDVSACLHPIVLYEGIQFAFLCTRSKRKTIYPLSEEYNRISIIASATNMDIWPLYCLFNTSRKCDVVIWRSMYYIPLHSPLHFWRKYQLCSQSRSDPSPISQNQW